MRWRWGRVQPKVCLDETEYILDRSEMRRVGRTSERHVPSLPNRLQRQRRHVLSQVVEEEHAIWSANWKKSRVQVLNPTVIVHIVGAELYSKVAHAIGGKGRGKRRRLRRARRWLSVSGPCVIPEARAGAPGALRAGANRESGYRLRQRAHSSGGALRV